MIEAILHRLEGVKQSGKKWMAKCPAHDDGRPSLMLSEREDGSVGIHCFAGCDTESVMHSIGLEMKDLFSDSLSPRDKAQYRYDALMSEFNSHQTLMKLYKYEIEDKGFGSINKQNYAIAIEKNINLQNEMRALKGKYKL